MFAKLHSVWNPQAPSPVALIQATITAHDNFKVETELIPENRARISTYRKAMCYVSLSQYFLSLGAGLTATLIAIFYDINKPWQIVSAVVFVALAFMKKLALALQDSVDKNEESIKELKSICTEMANIRELIREPEVRDLADRLQNATTRQRTFTWLNSFLRLIN